MCGIAGIAADGDPDRLAETVGRMTRRLAHRGPDAGGVLGGTGFAFGHRRLSIIDLSEAANQPMCDASDRFIITFNGEIYNFAEVRGRLGNYPFRTASDTETILAAYAAHGRDCLSMLSGMFAFAIWDRDRRELFVARDRMGVKPLYYAAGGGRFAFASEIRALLETGIAERRLDRQSLRDYLMFQSVYSPRTIVEGIRQFPAASWGIFREGRFETGRYWSIDADPSPIGEEGAPAVRERVHGLLREAVGRRLVSDVRLGAFLSGGIDSSAVVAMMAEAGRGPVNTFSVTFDEKEFDESAHSSAIAARFGTEHTSVRLGARAFLEALPAALAAADSPSGDGINSYVVSKATRESGLKVALSGIGGDELFAGYPNFLNWLRFRSGIIGRVPLALRRLAGAVFSRSGRSRRQRLGAMLSEPNRSIAAFYPLTRQVLSEVLVDRLAGPAAGIPTIAAELAERSDAIGRFPLLSQFSIAEFLGYTQNVLLKDADQFSMASALEVREPFFDHRLVEYVLRVPDRFKYPSYPKSLLVESLAPRLPGSIVHRPKMGFVLPWELWLRNDLREFCAARIDAAAARGIVERKAVSRLWDDFLERRGGVLWSHVWHIVVLSEWIEANGIDAA